MALCPHCGQPMPKVAVIRSAQALVEALRQPLPAGRGLTRHEKKTGSVPHRNVYAGDKGGYFVTRGGGDVDVRAVKEALAAGLIVPEWPDTPHEYWKLADTSAARDAALREVG